MKLYYFPPPNPQKVRFALLELGLECEIIPVESAYPPRSGWLAGLCRLKDGD
jgi:hypothetical protein